MRKSQNCNSINPDLKFRWDVVIEGGKDRESEFPPFIQRVKCFSQWSNSKNKRSLKPVRNNGKLFVSHHTTHGMMHMISVWHVACDFPMIAPDFVRLLVRDSVWCNEENCTFQSGWCCWCCYWYYYYFIRYGWLVTVYIHCSIMGTGIVSFPNHSSYCVTYNYSVLWNKMIQENPW